MATEKTINPFVDLDAPLMNNPLAPQSAAQSQNSGQAGVFASLQVGAGSVAMYTNRQGMWLGGATFANANFSVTMNGAVKAKTVEITGGTIGGQPIVNIGNISNPVADIAPTGLQVSSTGITTATDGTNSAYVVLNWDSISTGTFDHYLIRYKKHSYTYYAYIEARTNTIVIDGLVPNVSYDFAICSVNKYGIASSYSATVTTPTAANNTPPDDVTVTFATGGIQYVIVEWTHVSNADLASYNVYRSETNNSAGAELIGNVRTNYFVDGNRAGGTTYYYWVKAVNTSNKISENFLTAKSGTPRNVTSDDIVTIAGSKVLIDGEVYLSNWRKSGDLTKIDGGAVSAHTIETTALNFVAVQGTNVIASINTSEEGIQIAGAHVAIIGNTDFAALATEVSYKAQVFTAEPTTPYYADDLWANGTVLKKCGTQRLTGAYNAADWTLATGYTDDTVANSKIKTFIQDAIPTSISAGDFWIDSDGGNALYRATNAGDTTIAAGHWVAISDNNKLGGNGSAAVGGSYESAASGARVRIFPDANTTGLQVIDDNGNDVFKCVVGGTDVGDVIIGDYDHGQGIKYDANVGAYGTTYVSGELEAVTGTFKNLIIETPVGAEKNYIACGKTDFDNDELGLIMGMDGSDGNKIKIIFGGPEEYLAVIGNTFINTLKPPVYVASSAATLINSDTLRTWSGAGEHLIKEITVGRGGTYKCRFSWSASTGGANVTYSLRIDNTTEIAAGGGNGNIGDTLVSADTPTLVYGSKIGLYVATPNPNSSGASISVQNFKLMVSAVNEIAAPVKTVD